MDAERAIPPSIRIVGVQEPMAASPLWLAYSGLPFWLSEKVHKAAWLVFKTVVEVDCSRNARPGTIEIAPVELAERCGLESPVVMRVLEALRRKKLLALFLPEHPEEVALIAIKAPLETPRSVAQVCERFPFNRLPVGTILRYATRQESDAPATESSTARGKQDLQRVLDLYFNVVGVKMNSFILDELALLCQRFSMDEVEKVFDRAAKNDIRSLGWVVRELYRRNRKT